MMSLALLLLNVLVMSWLAWRSYRGQAPDLQRVFWPALSIKVLSGLALGVVYFFHYGAGDTISFWQDGNKLADFFRESPGRAISFLWNEASVPEWINALQQQTPRSIFFVKISGLLALISGGNYWLMATWLSLASFAGSWFLFVRVIRLFPDTRAAAVIALLFMPSVVFWSSGLIKESLGLAALFSLMAIGLNLVAGRRIRGYEWALGLAFLWIGWNLKYYWLGIFLPVALPAVMVAFMIRKYTSLERFDLLLWVTLTAAFFLFATNIHPNFYASRFLEVICQNNLEFTRMSDPPRLVQYLNLEPSTASILMNTPAALLAGLFRPFLWEAFNGLSAIAAIENLLILVLVLQALVSVPDMFRAPHRVLLLASLIYVLLLVTFLALSTPNFGTLSRYRIAVLPVLVLLCLLPATPAGKRLAARRWFG